MPDPQTLPPGRPVFRVPLAPAALAILAGCAAWFGWGLSSEPHFMDESAYLAQSFYGDLYMTGRWDHPAWLDYAGYDLPPLAKYVVGGALWLQGYPRPSRADAWAWYDNPGRRIGSDAALVAARRPMVALGAVGCAALFAVGALMFDRRVGALAALLLAANPLYRLHARRAMSDVPAEAFMLVALLLGLVAWRDARLRSPGWRAWACAAGAGVSVGLATLSKLNGVLVGLVLAGWVAVGVASGASARARWFLGPALVLAAALAFATFVALDPFLYAHPRPDTTGGVELARLDFRGRVRKVFDHRAEVSKGAMKSFPHNALPTLPDRAAVAAVQGFGRFGPLGPPGRSDSTVRFDRRQDWGACLWLPVVAAGLIVMVRRGLGQYNEGAPPLAALGVIYFGVVAAVVTSFIPLAWDRYLLSIQAPAALAGAVALVAAWDAIGSRLSARRPPPEGSP